MRQLTKFMFVLIVLFNFVFSNLIITAIASDDEYGTQTHISYYSIPYGNGVDDNHDGVIDDFNESDVQYGTVNVTRDTRVISTWYDNFTYPSPREYGVEIGAPYDRLYNISIDQPGQPSASPIYTCYDVTVTDGIIGYSAKGGVINLLSFYIKLAPEGLMNGASEIWYRSPIVWDNSRFKNYYLNIFDEIGNLVYATDDHVAVSTPSPYVVMDNSNYLRIYQKLNFNFRTDVRYYFREYIETKDNIPVSTFSCFLIDTFDLGKDNETDTYIFQGSPYSNKIPRECSWSMIPIVGIGVEGIEIPLWSNSDYNTTYNPQLLTSRIIGSSSILNVNTAGFVIPCRMSKELNFTVFCKTWSGNNVSNWTEGVSFNATGTLRFNTTVTDPDATHSNSYELMIRINNLNSTTNADAFMFKTFPASGSICGVNFNGSYLDIYHFAFHYELTLETLLVSKASSSIDWTGMLIGGLAVAAGVLAIAVGWETVIGAEAGFYMIGSGLAGINLAWGTAMAYTAFGGTLVILGTAEILNAINPSGTSLANNLIRVLLAMMNGVIAIAKGLLNIILQVWEAVKWFVNAIMTWGGDILWAIAEIIYFVAFVVVISLWGIFLSTMRYIAVGDAEGAWASLTKPFMKSYRWVRKRPVYKVGKQLAWVAVTKGASTGRQMVKR